ncbi:MAG: Signal peptidase complex catalytic subunit [Heterodermia speciosa]|uniref:Signal peptidase complex catalytic subunit SEC11 n=1 Tax=Heterodermia speciosa TaxID=116794 RepID=A0A8H3J2T1_9LECA|nr:MAG: Signal peptidase complex catalytic subunit [Heterodermia speciosa]
MEPAFYRGDVLFVWNRADVFEVGEIAVCWFKGRPLPMVHRIVQRMPDVHMETWKAAGGNESIAPSVPAIPQYQYLTKGDNNDRDDVPLYPPGQLYVKRSEIIGTIKGYVPYAGWVTILLSEHPWLKTAVFGAVGSFSLLRRRPKTTQKISG